MPSWFDTVETKTELKTPRIITLAAITLACALLLCATLNSEEWPGTVMRVVDGDTIKVWDGVGIRPGDSCMVLHQDEYGRTIPCPDQLHETVIRLIGGDPHQR